MSFVERLVNSLFCNRMKRRIRWNKENKYLRPSRKNRRDCVEQKPPQTMIGSPSLWKMETRSTRRHDFTTHLEFRKFAVLVVLLFVVSFCSQERSVFLVTSNHTKIFVVAFNRRGRGGGRRERDDAAQCRQSRHHVYPSVWWWCVYGRARVISFSCEAGVFCSEILFFFLRLFFHLSFLYESPVFFTPPFAL